MHCQSSPAACTTGGLPQPWAAAPPFCCQPCCGYCHHCCSCLPRQLLWSWAAQTCTCRQITGRDMKHTTVKASENVIGLGAGVRWQLGQQRTANAVRGWRAAGRARFTSWRSHLAAASSASSHHANRTPARQVQARLARWQAMASQSCRRRLGLQAGGVQAAGRTAAGAQVAGITPHSACHCSERGPPGRVKHAMTRPYQLAGAAASITMRTKMRCGGLHACSLN